MEAAFSEQPMMVLRKLRMLAGVPEDVDTYSEISVTGSQSYDSGIYNYNDSVVVG
jgi:hypothetical protein